jgi:hypothetical protein
LREVRDSTGDTCPECPPDLPAGRQIQRAGREFSGFDYIQRGIYLGEPSLNFFELVRIGLLLRLL